MKWLTGLESGQKTAIILVGMGSVLSLAGSLIFFITPKSDNEQQFMVMVGVQNNLASGSLAIISGSLGYLSKSIVDKLDSNDNKENKQ
jgi:hypothetical protein